MLSIPREGWAVPTGHLQGARAEIWLLKNLEDAIPEPADLMYILGRRILGTQILTVEFFEFLENLD